MDEIRFEENNKMGDECKYYVYGLIDPRTSLPFYVGKGEGNRWRVHLQETINTTENRKKFAFIQGLRNKGLEPKMIKYCERLEEERAYNLEEELIKLYGRRDIDVGGVLTNICESSRPPSHRGIKHSKEHCENISKALLGHKAGMTGHNHTEATKRKMSRANIGRIHSPMSEETKRKITLANRGRKHSTESKLRISESRKGIQFSDAHKRALSKAGKGRRASKETRMKMSESHKGLHKGIKLSAAVIAKRQATRRYNRFIRLFERK